ncbi:MAG: helix-turn-helix domain-containing protein [Lachnospiraceae bacterium]|nr:helix-turn-helix domain-containing protein [Lachnospiraceae bacterium]
MKRKGDNKLGSLLKEYRKLNGYSVSEVIAMLKDKSYVVAEKTMYGWENGRSCPDLDTFFTLCEIYNINDVMKAFGYKESKPFSITEHEKKFIESYRKHKDMQAAVDKILDVTVSDKEKE